MTRVTPRQTKVTAVLKTQAEYYCGLDSNHIMAGQPHLERLMQMFTYKRPHASASEAEFIARFIKPVMDEHVSWSDEYGNIYIDLRTSPKHRTLFTSHVDTVHRDAGRQTVNFDPVTGLISVRDGSCLGADDGSGIAMLLHMIEHGVPALYIFTRDEERGGNGARHIAENYEPLLLEFDRAIAFDRRADYSVITHQGWGRCCSDEFAEALAEQLSNDWLMYAPDDTGVYTDTAEFTIIPECSNLSIGYDHEHTEREVQNLYHFQRLADAVLTVAWDSLPVERDPSVRDAWVWGKYLPTTGGAYADWPDLDDELEAQRIADVDWLLDSMGYMGLDAADLSYDELTAASAACEFIYDGRDTELRELLKAHAQCELQIPAAMDAETLKEWLEQCLIAGVSVATRALANVIKGE